MYEIIQTNHNINNSPHIMQNHQFKLHYMRLKFCFRLITSVLLSDASLIPQRRHCNVKQKGDHERQSGCSTAADEHQ